MITVTDTATEKLKEILDDEGQPEAALRVIVVPQGGGAQYLGCTHLDQRRTLGELLVTGGDGCGPDLVPTTPVRSQQSRLFSPNRFEPSEDCRWLLPSIHDAKLAPRNPVQFTCRS